MSNEGKPAASPGAANMEKIESPLAGVNPRSLDALMAEDVGKLSEQEFEQIIAELRAQRAGWKANEEAKAKAEADGVKATRKRAPRVAGSVTINLDDLLGDI